MSRNNKMPGGGGFAPVLPATGLHSYHNDSPPFSGATNPASGEPEPLHLNGPDSHTHGYGHGHGHGGNVNQAGPSRSSSSSSSTGAGNGRTTQGLLNPGVDSNSTQNQLNSSQNQNDLHGPDSNSQSHGNTSSSSNLNHISNSNPNSSSNLNPSRPKIDRVLTSPTDVSYSSSRSRRLVSGYMFGNPPEEKSLKNRRDSESTVRRLSVVGDDGLNKDRGGTDKESLENRTIHGQEEVPEDQNEEEQADDTPHPLRPRPSSAHSFTTNPTSQPDEENLSVASSLRNSPRDSPLVSPGRGLSFDNGRYEDALNGVTDGEADADVRAMQATGGGSEGFMQGLEGEEGRYNFPTHRLRRRMKDEDKVPLVIVACGSFSPPTYLHLRMFEMAKDEIVESQTFEIMAGYYSPVSSYYKKSGLAPAHHRVRMCELAVEHTSTWLMVDPWEAGQPEYQRTAVVLDHFDEMLNGKDGEGGVEMRDGTRRKYKVMLLAGGDLIESFGEPGVWSEPDLHIILGRFGCLIVERAGSDVWAFLLSHDILYHHRRNVIVIKQLIYNDISSTKVRLFVRRGMSIKYLLPNSVIQYISKNLLYREPDTKAIQS
ncbi:nicotinate-nucleotide adenylyltransferase [Filobasidium floriforme]|uniref:nicotinate-nucleotide adenylyltransferase n=1 Tax=Filobasidium floriforme TaxID=5210 RepID=UPI001E8DE0D3|nr:nicotinate-nucleotide adenylyltransferase [Filobasidium floriforme]KAH8083078.1 nicotinate-nucleotide adenylyltransferase [Filobasidium floriforme]